MRDILAVTAGAGDDDDDDDDDDINLRPADASETCCPGDLPRGIGTC
jgi:hypothetical protein